MAPQVVGRIGSMYSRSMVSRVTPSWGQSCTLWVSPLWDNLWAKALVYKMIAQMEMESLDGGTKGLKKGDNVSPRL